MQRLIRPPGRPEAEKTKPVSAAATAQKIDAAAEATATVNTGEAAKETAAPPKNNNKLWKEYTDSLTATLKTELLPSKKIKKDTYFLVVEYEIGADGQVNIGNVFATPENAFLQEEVKKRMALTAPQLTPVTDSSGKVRKMKRKYTFNLTKE